MGATTTQGTGPGMVQPKPGLQNKKVKETAQVGLSLNNFFGPRVVAAGIIKLQGETGKVCFAAQVGNIKDYCVLLTNNSPSNPFLSYPLSEESQFWSFEVTAGINDVVSYVVLRSGS